MRESRKKIRRNIVMYTNLFCFFFKKNKMIFLKKTTRCDNRCLHPQWSAVIAARQLARVFVINECVTHFRMSKRERKRERGRKRFNQGNWGEKKSSALIPSFWMLHATNVRWKIPVLKFAGKKRRYQKKKKKEKKRRNVAPSVTAVAQSVLSHRVSDFGEACGLHARYVAICTFRKKKKKTESQRSRAFM